MGAGCSDLSSAGGLSPVQFTEEKRAILDLLRTNSSLQQALPLKVLTTDELWTDVSGDPPVTLSSPLSR
jgi:hypothetical protein